MYQERERERENETEKRRLATCAFLWSNSVFQVLEKAHVPDAMYF